MTNIRSTIAKYFQKQAGYEITCFCKFAIVWLQNLLEENSFITFLKIYLLFNKRDIVYLK